MTRDIPFSCNFFCIPAILLSSDFRRNSRGPKNGLFVMIIISSIIFVKKNNVKGFPMTVAAFGKIHRLVTEAILVHPKRLFKWRKFYRFLEYLPLLWSFLCRLVCLVIHRLLLDCKSGTVYNTAWVYLAKTTSLGVLYTPVNHPLL